MVEITPERINIELPMSIKSEIISFSLITLHKNTKTQYMGPFLIMQCFTNGTGMMKYIAPEIRYNICRIMPYKFDIKVEYFNSINMYDTVNI